MDRNDTQYLTYNRSYKMTFTRKTFSTIIASAFAATLATSSFAVDIIKDMPKAQQEKAGLNKLTADELKFLNQWLKSQKTSKASNTVEITKENFGLAQKDIIKEKTNKIFTTVKETEKLKRGKYVITFANDQVWKTTESKRILLKEGDEVEVKITAIDRKKRTINLSIKAKETDDEQATVSEYAPETGGTAKLGDILKEQLDK